jgi:hypothetical protein
MAWPPLLDVVLDPPDDVVDLASEHVVEHRSRTARPVASAKAHDDDGDLGNDLDLPLEPWPRGFLQNVSTAS